MEGLAPAEVGAEEECNAAAVAVADPCEVVAPTAGTTPVIEAAIVAKLS